MNYLICWAYEKWYSSSIMFSLHTLHIFIQGWWKCHDPTWTPNLCEFREVLRLSKTQRTTDINTWWYGWGGSDLPHAITRGWSIGTPLSFLWSIFPYILLTKLLDSNTILLLVKNLLKFDYNLFTTSSLWFLDFSTTLERQCQPISSRCFTYISEQ